MSENPPFTISSFYKFIEQKRLMAAKCNKCGMVLLPPKPMCTKCLSTNLRWIELEGTGKLVSYTVIHVAPEQFQSMIPYTVGIIELRNGLRLPGMVCGLDPEKVRVGMKLKIDFETSTSVRWPEWPRYFFRSS
jgi:uncharacterized OB-fold protein